MQRRFVFGDLLDQLRDERRPAGLVRRAQPLARIAVEVLVEEQVVAPVADRVSSVESRALKRPQPVGAGPEEPDQPVRERCEISQSVSMSPEPVGNSTLYSSPR